MQSLWNEADAAALGGDALALRVYTTRLLGGDSNLVLHGGGNTSVKTTVKNFFGEDEAILYVKGSGADMAVIEPKGFAPVKMEVLLKLATFETLSDIDMVRQQRAAMIDPDAPAPSVEAILHAIIPFKYVDHTHADAVVALTNTPDGEAHVRAVYGERVIVIPYVMPGFDLARAVYLQTQELDWSRYEGMILLNHGIFTFADDACEAYERMIRLVTEAEQYLAARGAYATIASRDAEPVDLLALSRLRKAVSAAAGKAMIAQLDTTAAASGFASLPNVGDIATRGPLTPDHVIRTKRISVIVDDEPEAAVAAYGEAYRAYFERNARSGLTMLDPAPRWAVWRGKGVVTFGENADRAQIATDIMHHTIQTIQAAEGYARWQALPEKPIFDVEYWSLEQAKLKSGKAAPEFEGKIVLVTGAASGIGKAIAEAFLKRGAAVIALDINHLITTRFNKRGAKGIVCDVTDEAAMRVAVEEGVGAFGGLDILVSNAGIFPPSARIEAIDSTTWQHSIDINLTSHQRMFQLCIPYLKHGIDPSILVVASKNYPAPGPGAAAYSVAKAGLTQLARVAALELAEFGIRVNMVHPDAVFDTGIWTPEVLAKRAENYKMSVDEYKTKNMLHVAITSHDVAELICAMAGKAFRCTTGAQVPIDGGNDRVI
jgi:rhamnose utilization protein RhaD (predicted bifunctional aldolase and dehydrogenase)/NAD(P)-dependent dehydrogenase (short-subunit alcohol dehydrogenase family)